MANNKYLCVCGFCGKEFYTADMYREVCFRKVCIDRFKLSKKRRINSVRISIAEVERRALEESKRLKKTVTYGQMSLLLDTGIKTF